MISFAQQPVLAYLVFAALVISQLPRFGHAVLDFLRDLDRYLSDRRENGQAMRASAEEKRPTG